MAEYYAKKLQVKPWQMSRNISEISSKTLPKSSHIIKTKESSRQLHQQNSGRKI